MSRRRGEFEHRTSIFEGAFRAWSYLGGLDPIELEAKSVEELDPLSKLAVERSKFDPRLTSPECKEQLEEKDIERRIFPYEPLPRSGLQHPFVQAILTPWLGQEADSNAIQLGLTTLRTWWQHRRKGESGSAIAALGTEKMIGVVDHYTRHFFSLAYHVVKNGKESPPKTYLAKMKELEKQRSKQSKRRLRDAEKDNVTGATLQTGMRKSSSRSLQSNSPTSMGSESTASEFIGPFRGAKEHKQGLMEASSVHSAASLNGTSNLSALEQFALIQSHLYPESRPSMGQYNTETTGINLSLQQLALQKQIDETKSLLMEELYMASLSKETQSYPRRSSLPIGTTLTEKNYSVPRTGSETLCYPSYANPSKGFNVEAGIDNKVPIVVIYPSGEAHIAMRVDGIDSLHCVKIVETVLKGCSGKKAPIEGLLDAAADHELSTVMIKIDKSANARRIAKESSRNMAMVGYTAKVIERSAELALLNANTDPGIFEVLANTEITDLFNWNSVCSCVETGFSRKDCMRHRQLSPRIFNAFWMAQYLIGSNSTFSFSSAAPSTFQPMSSQATHFSTQKPSFPNKVDITSDTTVAGLVSLQTSCYLTSSAPTNLTEGAASQAISLNTSGIGGMPDSLSSPLVALSSGTNPAMKLEELDDDFMSSEQVSKQLTATAFAALKTSHRDSVTSLTFGRRRFSHASETTFGRALSGLSALSIDWENMDDFDIDVDHSAHVNNDLTGFPVKQPKLSEDGAVEGINAGSSAFIEEESDGSNLPATRRSSLRGMRRVGVNDWSLSVSFKDEQS